MMKNILICVCILFCGYVSNAQCDCETIYRSTDKIVQCKSMMVATDNKSELGLALASNGQNTYITLTIRFDGKAFDVVDDLFIRLVNNQLLAFELINSQLGYIGNSDVVNAVFLIKTSDSDKLRYSNMKTISLTMADSKIHLYQCTKNKSVLMRQINCM